jgi:transketolase N-terminal domain/subunit
MSAARPRSVVDVSAFEAARPHWEKVADVIDQCIDLMLNHRQSGHPGGSRSKVHAVVTTLLSGAMRYDFRHPTKRFNDRCVLVAGHTAPVFYATLAVLNDALRARHRKTGDSKFAIPHDDEYALYPEHLLDLRRNGGLPGHAEMEGRTLFFKFNTGPTGHGAPAAAGEALALKHAGADDVRVFAFEGEGGHTAGATHETKNSAWGLGLSNLVYVLDWNDFGIDPNANSSVVYGNPQVWFESYGWKTTGTESGSEFPHVVRAFHEALDTPNPDGRPIAIWLKTVKGRGYGVTGYKSHGKAHERNGAAFWATKKEFMDRHGVVFDAFGTPDVKDAEELRRQCAANLGIALDVLRNDAACLDWLTDRLVAIGDSVPHDIPGLRMPDEDPSKDPVIADWKHYPEALYAKPGEEAANGKAFATWAAWLNAHARTKWGRPLVIASSADLAESTNIAGFAKDFGDVKGFGWYDRSKNPGGALLPQQITEFANAGISVGLATVNFSASPLDTFSGYWAACSTYGSFSYLEVRPDAPLLATRAGLPLEGGQGHLGRRPLRPGNRGRFTHALRNLRARRRTAFPRRSHDQRVPVGTQRSGTAARRRACDERSDRRPASDATADHRAGSREARHAFAPRRRSRRLRDARLPGGTSARRLPLRAGDVDDVGTRQTSRIGRVRRRRFEREGRRGSVVGSLSAPIAGIPRVRRRQARLGRFDGRRELRASHRARLDRHEGGRGLRDHAGLRQSMADGRFGRGDPRRGPYRRQVDFGRRPTIREGSSVATRPDAGHDSGGLAWEYAPTASTTNRACTSSPCSCTTASGSCVTCSRASRRRT